MATPVSRSYALFIGGAPETDGVTVAEVASTGLSDLDLVLGGLYWGDNVVWEVGEDASAEPFYRAISTLAPQYDLAAYVTLTDPPAAVRARYPGFDVLDARAGGRLAQPAPLARAIFDRCRPSQRNLLLVDPLETIAERWGAPTTARFFGLCCPNLLQRGAIAYWSIRLALRLGALRREVESVTQCVVVLGKGRLRISMAEGRPAGVVGTVFRYRLEDGVPRLTAAPAAARLGAALRALRLERGLSQSELARSAGVSASAISQAERGQRGLSLDTLLELTARLNITLDELLRGEIAAGYRLGRRAHPKGHAAGRPVPLLDDPQAGLRVYLVRLAARAEMTTHISHKGVEVVAVARGLVQVGLATGRPVLRAGEALLAERSGVVGWRNVGDSEAVLFWVLRDPIAAP